MLRYKPRDVTGTSRAWEELLLNIVQVPYATEQAWRGVEINFVSCFSAVSRKRGAGISNRVRAKRLSRLLPSAGSCTSTECVGGGPRAGSNETRQVSCACCLRVLSGASTRGSSRRSSHVRGATADLGMPVSLRKINESRRLRRN